MKDYGNIEQKLQESYDGLLSAAKAPDIKIDHNAKISRRESVSEFFGRPGMQIAAAALAVIFTVGGIYSFIFYFGSKNPGKKPIPAVSDTETAVGTDEESGGYTTDELTETEEEISDMTAQETTEPEEPSNTGTETGEENTETEEEKTEPETDEPVYVTETDPSDDTDIAKTITEEEVFVTETDPTEDTDITQTITEEEIPVTETDPQEDTDTVTETDTLTESAAAAPEPLQIVLTDLEDRKYSYYVGKLAGEAEYFKVFLKNASDLASISVTVSWDERLELFTASNELLPGWYPDDSVYEICRRDHSYTFEWKADDPEDAVSGDLLFIVISFSTPENVASRFNINFTVNTSGTYNTAGQKIPSSSKRIPIETVYAEWSESVPETDPEPETETEEITEPYFPYDIYLPQNVSNAFEKNDKVTPLYNGENLFKYKHILRKDVPDITVELFGYERTMSFSYTEEHYAYGVTLDAYRSNNPNESVVINRKTGKIVEYSCSSRNKDFYDSPVNAHSSREEFIQYARDLLLEYTGVSTEGCEAIVSTHAIGTTYKYTKEELNTDFVNFTEYDPDFSARYEIRFQKKIGEVNRADRMIVEVNNDGTVQHIYGLDMHDEYEPFADVEIDVDSIIRYVEDRIDDVKKKYDITPGYITLMAVPLDGNYWVLVEQGYSITSAYGGRTTGGSVQYLVLIKGDFENPDYLMGDYNMYVDYEYDYEPDPAETGWE